MSSVVRDYLVKETGGKKLIEVLYPMPDEAWKCARNAPTCDLGLLLVEIFGRWPSNG